MTDGPRTFGALLIGAMIAAGFTGILNSQCMSYVKLYPKDRPIFKILVLLIWLLDASHIISVTVALWEYLIDHAGDEKEADYIPKSLALSIAFTAITTLLVHCFLIHRIYRLSHNAWYIALPLAFLVILRTCAAIITTEAMIRFRSFSMFMEASKWSFTLGLALSSILDVLNTGLLCWLLYDSQQDTSSLNHVIDTLMLYTFENGALTCAIAVASMICWLAMPTNLIFMGLHFIISKTYAISLVVT
ncbi:hypothetical protein Moror_4552 [Moniliophthora roreri MCA 2997]|uniref:DUF6534 domain-containing protein n=1 Tax=Moniliophthora roreri (strain MCA 2997) TaxID=1381753 RepID=V2XHV2_MONRO|nr:hypothetical protein Moror_4552 [Moniliophthora roreri MCA 2997]